MKTICIGSVSSGCGKTSVAELLLKAFPGWAALKVTPCRPDEACPSGRDCGACEPPADGFEIITDRNVLARPGKDTARLLKAGASRVIWVRSVPKSLSEALESALALLSDAPGVIVESTTAVPLFEGFRVVVTMNGAVEMKASAREALACADLIALNLTDSRPSALAVPTDVESAAPVVSLRASLPPSDPANREFVEICRCAVERAGAPSKG